VENETPSGRLEYKDFSFDLKLDELSEDGQFEGYASVFNNEDAHREIIEPGAFKKTLRESKGQVPVLWQHDPWEPIGVSLELEEDDKGLRTRGQLVLETQRGAEAYALLKSKALKGLSIGFQTIKWLVDRDAGIRRLKEIKLWEYSLVTYPANPLATVGNVKTVEIARLARFLRELRDTDPDTVKALLEAIEPPDGTRGAGAADLDEEPDADALSTLRAFHDDAKNFLTLRKA